VGFHGSQLNTTIVSLSEITTLLDCTFTRATPSAASADTTTTVIVVIVIFGVLLVIASGVAGVMLIQRRDDHKSDMEAKGIVI
jgi:signal transduction histidine kinase